MWWGMYLRALPGCRTASVAALGEHGFRSIGRREDLVLSFWTCLAAKVLLHPPRNGNQRVGGPIRNVLLMLCVFK
jgi:hypothetical protein